MSSQQSDSIISIAVAQDILSKYADRIFYTLTKDNTEEITITYPQDNCVVSKILAEDIYAPINVPDFDNSAMDGYVLHTDALHFAEGAEYSSGIPVVYEVCAGGIPPTLKAGACAKIFTGAPIPEGANAVVPQEHCLIHTQEKIIQILADCVPSEGNHVRQLGLNYTKGSLVCKKGSPITMGVLTILASLGITSIRVYKKIDIALCVSGNELQSQGKALAGGQIYDTNSTLLSQLCNRYGIHINTFSRLEDDKETTRQKLHILANTHDLVVCTGGVSVGDKDYIQQVLLEDGKVYIRKVSIKPGKPFTLVSLLNTPFVCLPGNPLSVYVTFLWFVVPFIQQIQGLVYSVYNNPLDVPHPLLTLQSPQQFLPYPRSQFIFSKLDSKNNSVKVLQEQSSSALKNIMQADGALIIPQDTQINKGDTVYFFLF